jgi:hypothetical protein
MFYISKYWATTNQSQGEAGNMRRTFCKGGSPKFHAYTLNFPRAEILEPPRKAYSLMGVPMLMPGFDPPSLAPEWEIHSGIFLLNVLIYLLELAHTSYMSMRQTTPSQPMLSARGFLFATKE